MTDEQAPNDPSEEGAMYTVSFEVVADSDISSDALVRMEFTGQNLPAMLHVAQSHVDHFVERGHGSILTDDDDVQIDVKYVPDTTSGISFTGRNVKEAAEKIGADDSGTDYQTGVQGSGDE